MKKKNDNFSVGIICYTIINNKIKYLLICRKSSLNYMAFLMGKYSITHEKYIIELFNLMSNDEKKSIFNNDFDTLWFNLWNNNNCRNYNLEKDKFYKFKKIYNLENIINNSNKEWETPEWGFPKGRKETYETCKQCALREFNEETGYSISSINIINNVVSFNEYVIGSNNKLYKHKYFLAYMKPENIKNFKIQEVEVSKLKWLTLNECLENIRYYNYEKVKIIKKIDKFLNKYKIII